VRKSKTAAGVRTLPLIDDAKRVLQQHRGSRRAAVASIDGYVFCRPDGQPLYHQLVHNRWNDLLGVAGVTHMCRNCGSDERCSSSVRRFHTTRHTAATMLLERGVGLEVVSAILGHSNIGMTAGVYAKVRSDLKRRRARPSRRPPALTGRSPQSRRPAAVDPGADGAGRPPELATARRSAVQLVAREMARQRGLDAEASARADFERCEFPSGGCRFTAAC
jgi:hypothetical protein